MRNQYRGRVFSTNIENTGEALAKTEIFKASPGSLASQMDYASKLDGNGFVYTNADALAQSGVTRDVATARVDDGGLGIAPEVYDKAASTGMEMAVGHGTAAVFGQMQKEAGNQKAFDAFGIDVDGVKVGDIKAQRAEQEATVAQAEQIFNTLGNGDDTILPPRLKLFRAGLRAANYEQEQADAMVSMLHAGAQRNAEVWGISEDEWLARHSNLRIAIDEALMASNNPRVKYFRELLAEDMQRQSEPQAMAAQPAAPEPMQRMMDVRARRRETMDAARPEPQQAVPSSIQQAAEEIAAATGAEPSAVAPVVEQIVEEVRTNPEARAVVETLAKTATLFPAAEPTPPAAPELIGVEGAVGAESEIIFPRDSGVKPLPVRYALVEADALQPSHTPSTFALNPAWPQEYVAQQRNYDSPAMAATREGIRVSQLDFGVLFNPTTDAVNGSPVITPDGLVLGGNNRSLRILNRYDQDGYKMMLDAQLSRRSNTTGIRPEAAAAMKRPVLVRVAEGVEPQNIPSIIGDLNRDFTNRRDAGSLAANRGINVGEKTIRAFGGIGDQTVSQFLDNPDRAYRVIQAMMEEGVFQETDIPSLINMVDMKWLPGGKAQIEQALFGAVLPDARLLEEMTPGMQRKIMKALPALVRLKASGSPELSDLFQAVRWHNEYQQFKETDLGKQYKTDAARMEAFRKPEMADMFTGEVPPEKSGAAWDMMLEIAKAKSQKDVAEFFARKADEISGVGRGLFSLSQGAVNEKRAKFDAAPTLAVITEGVAAIPDGAGFTGRLVEWARGRGILGAFENTDTGWNDINVTATSIRDVNSHKAAPGKLAVLEVVPELIRNGIYLETTQRNEQGHLSHVFAGKVEVDGIPHVVGFTINEDVNGKRYYNHELTEMEPENAPAKDIRRTGTYQPLTPSREHIGSILRRHLFVNADTPIIDNLYQDALNNQERGRIEWTPDATTIRLFEGADVSTVVHEINHLFLMDLTKAYRAGRGGDRLKAHIETLNEFTNGDLLAKDAETQERGFERIAGAWERWAAEGIAPSNALEEPFDVFRHYITLAYRGAIDQLSEPSPAVRRVFDAFLATDEEIAAAARRRENAEEWEKAGFDSKNVRAAMDKQFANREKRRRKAIDKRRGGGRQMKAESRLDAAKRVVKGELEKERVYHAVAIAKAKGGISRKNAVEMLGGKTVSEIAKRHGESVFGTKGSAPQVAAMAGYGMDNVSEMLSDMAAAEGIDAVAERRAAEKVNAEFEAEQAVREPETTAQTDEEADEERNPIDDEIDPDDPEIADAVNVVAAAIVDEATDDGANQTDEARRAAAEGLARFRDNQAAARATAKRDVYSRGMHEAANVAIFEKQLRAARRKSTDILKNGKTAKAIAGVDSMLSSGMASAALEQARAQDRAALTKAKQEELLWTYAVKYSKKARALLDYTRKNYSKGALLATLGSTDKKAKVEHEYAVYIARLAKWAGMADSKALRKYSNADPAQYPDRLMPQNEDALFGGLADFEAGVPEWLLARQLPRNFADFRDFTAEQLFEVQRVMKHMLDAGRGKLAGMREGVAENLRDFVGKSTAPMKERKELEYSGNEKGDPNKTLGAIQNSLNRFLINGTVPEYWFQSMDGNPTIQGKKMGFNQENIFLPLEKAAVDENNFYGDKVKGIYESIVFLSDVERKRWDKENTGFMKDAKVISAFGRTLAVPEILRRGRHTDGWNHDLLLSIAMNMGNDANLRRILSDKAFAERFGYDPESLVKRDADGNPVEEERYNLSNEDLEVIQAQFSGKAWEHIQKIWDIQNQIFAEADSVYFRMNNRHLAKEPAVAVEVMTSDGTRKQMKGGYFPLANDPMLSFRAGQIQSASSRKANEEITTSLVQNSLQPMAGRQPGALNERSRDEGGAPTVTIPQYLSMNVLFRHMKVMAHYVTHAEAVQRTSRVLNDREWAKTYVSRFGQTKYNALKKWHQNIANPPRVDNLEGESWLDWMKHKATVAILGLRFTSGMKQPLLGSTQAAAFMGDAAGNYLTGVYYLNRGIAEFGSNGGGILGFNSAKREYVNSKSNFMRARDGGQERDLREMRDRIHPMSKRYFGYTTREIENAMFIPIQQGDRVAAYSAWLGGYAQAKDGHAGFDPKEIHAEKVKAAGNDPDAVQKAEAEAELEVERLAVRYADSVARTQASSFAADLTAIQSSPGLLRFFSMFMSGNVRQGSRLMQRFDALRAGQKSGFDLAAFVAEEFVAPAVMWALTRAAGLALASAAFGYVPDDEYDMRNEILWNALDNSLAWMPLGRDVVGMLHYGSWSGLNAPATRLPKDVWTNIVGMTKNISKEEYGYAVGRGLKVAGDVFGIPVMNPLTEFGFDKMIGLKKPKRKAKKRIAPKKGDEK